MPLIVQSTKHHSPSFNLSIIKSQMQMATKSKVTREDTQVAIVNMYQNGTTPNLSPQAQKAAQVLAHYIYQNKTKKTFAFVLGKDHQGKQLLLLTIANHSVKTMDDASLQKTIQQAPTSPQKPNHLSSATQLWWVTKALQEAEFGILFWIYQYQLSSQEAIASTTLVPPSITAVNFQRVKTPHEQLQDKVWAKIMQVVHHLTPRQLKISANAQQLPSQTKITTSTIELALQKIITDDDALSKVAQKLIKADNIEVQLVDKTGVVMITIKNYGHDKVIRIFGFKATGTPLAIAQAKIDVAQDGATPPTKLNQVFHGQTPMASDVNAPIKEGVIFTFQSATTVNDKGEAKITYTVGAMPVIRDATPRDLIFTVGGFETKNEAEVRDNIDKANAKIQAVTTTTVALPTKKSMVQYGVKPVSNDLNPPSQIGFSFSFKEASAINDKGEVEVTYTVNVVPVIRDATPRDLIFTVGGFETKAEALKKANARIQALVAGRGRGITKPTKKRTVREGWTPRSSDVNPPIKQGFSFSFKRADVVSNYKDADVIYTVDVMPAIRGTTTRDILFIVRGF